MNRLFNDGFSFLLMDKGSSFDDFKRRISEASEVTVPHDWAIGDFKSFYKDGVGGYVKHFDFDGKSPSGNENHYFIRFDGIYMDSTIYLNGNMVYEWKYGYTSFVVEVTDFLIAGENELIVLVNYQNPNSRWYSGAGIYRNVWWIECGETYIPDGGIYVHFDPIDEGQLAAGCNLTVWVKVEGKAPTDSLCIVPTLSYQTEEVELSNYSVAYDEDNTRYEITCQVLETKLWSVDNPNLYKLKIDLCSDSSVCLQSETINIGFRYTSFTTDDGFFLNGIHMKLNGVCEHHDFGSLGAAFYPDALVRKIDILKAMGVNSIRTSHNPVPREFYDICDRMGILVDAEAFDMWEMPKTTYDYARFFPKWYKRDVERWVLDARNHPSVIMWSIGNEIPDTHAGARGREVAADLTREVNLHDPLGNARITFGSNYMPWENTQKVADDIKLVGYNYAESYYDEHHEAHPDWVIYGSETSSIVYSRGVYHFPLAAGILSDDDLQCSALGNSTTSWGASSIEACIGVDAGKKYSLGQYLWTGFDYLGEPTPYWTKNSYFGQVDTAGFPKDAYYMWQAAWTKPSSNPMVHIFPYWNFNLGQKIDVRVTSNAFSVELFVNGESQGKQILSDGIVSDYLVFYEPGELLAVAYDEAGKEVARDVRHSFGDTDHICITKSRYGSLLFCECQAVDSDGFLVEDACDYLEVNVSKGKLLSLDNGDSTDYDSFRIKRRRLFRGKLLAIISCEQDAEPEVDVCICRDFTPVREIVLERKDVASGPVVLTKEKDFLELRAYVLPRNADNQNIEFRLADIFGNTTQLAELEVTEQEDYFLVRIHGLGDGEFILRAQSNDGEDHVRAISQLEIKAEGLGTLFTNPYNFVPGSVYSRSIGGVTNGNERGVATGRDGETTVIFDGVDFGNAGTRELEIPIFALTDEEYIIRIWDGVPDEADSELICDGRYQKKSIWNTYQSETFVLSKKLTGIRTISFQTTAKIHFKGFVCTQINPIFENLWAGEAQTVYGDMFERCDRRIEHIGNNVTIGFGKMDFEAGVSAVTIEGRARGGVNTLHLRLNKQGEVTKEVLEFAPSDEYMQKTFKIKDFTGEGELSVIFMPGSDFDLGWIRFNK